MYDEGSAMLAPSTECVWGCGRSNFNEEHVIGRQFAKAMNLPDPLIMRWADYARQEHALEIVLNDRVCEGCNSRWMKKLDDRVRKLMGPSIIDGAPVDISSVEQLRLARWAMKVALLLMLWVHDECAEHPELLEATRAQEPGRTDEPYVPVDDFADVGRRHRPPSGVLIWIGAASDEIPDFFTSVSALSRPAEPVPERFGYYAMFALRRLIVFVAAGLQNALDGPLADIDPATLDLDKLVLIWPRSTASVHWPSAQALTATDVASFTGSHPSFAVSEPPAEVEPDGP
jgi:hypothetical protein